MPKNRWSQQRKTEVKKQNTGKLVLFCEGATERYYFEHFAAIINQDQNEYNNVVIATKLANGNAQQVLN